MEVRASRMCRLIWAVPGALLRKRWALAQCWLGFGGDGKEAE
jgi:hypothetical protein